MSEKKDSFGRTEGGEVYAASAATTDDDYNVVDDGW